MTIKTFLVRSTTAGDVGPPPYRSEKFHYSKEFVFLENGIFEKNKSEKSFCMNNRSFFPLWHNRSRFVGNWRYLKNARTFWN